MPITINGSGTITGLSVGGLPDGIVDEDTLANLAVSTGKIANSAVTSAKASGLGISEYDMWRCTDGSNSTQDPITTWTRESDKSNLFTKIGTGMTHSSGIFTFPSTGIYKITFSLEVYNASTTDGVNAQIKATTDNGSYSTIIDRNIGIRSSGDTEEGYAITTFDCTNTSTHKLKFVAADFKSSTVMRGSSTNSETYVIFERVGPT